MPIFGPKCQFWAKFGRFWAPNPIFLGAGSKNFGTLVSGFQWDTFFVLKTLIIEAPIGRQGRKCAFLTPKFGYLGPKVNFLFSDRDFCWWSKWPLYPGLQLSHRNHPQKISVSELGVIFWGSPLFLAVFGHSHFRGATTLNFGPISTKLGGIVRAIKKMTQKDNGPGLGRNYGVAGVFTFGQKVVFGLKMGFSPKNHPKWHFPPWLFGQRALFSLNNFFRSWPEHG